MKKVLFGLFVLSAIASASEGHFYLRAGLDFAEEFDEIHEESFKVNDSESDDTGYELGVEYLREVYPNLELGLGISYQNHGAPKGSSDSFVYYYDDPVEAGKDKDWNTEEYDMPEFRSIPLYATAKYNIPVEWNVKPYLKFDFGYSFNDGDNLKVKWTEYEMQGDVITDNITNIGSAEIATKINDGIYYGLGAGLQYNDFTVDLMYKVNTAEVETTTESDSGTYTTEHDIDYSRFVLSFGYRF